MLHDTITILTNTAHIKEALQTKNLIYKESELEIIEKSEMNEESIREVHKIKKFFHGWIVEGQKNAVQIHDTSEKEG